MANYARSKKEPEVITLEVHPAELKLLQSIRKIQWGELDQIKIQDGIPVLIKMAFKTIKL